MNRNETYCNETVNSIAVSHFTAETIKIDYLLNKTDLKCIFIDRYWLLLHQTNRLEYKANQEQNSRTQLLVLFSNFLAINAYF